MSHELRLVKRKQHLYQTVQDEIKNYIIQNSLKAGDVMPPEGVLAQQLGISRNSVREAVKSLETLGVLDARPGAGLFVGEFSFDPIIDHLGFGLMFAVDDLEQLEELLEVRTFVEIGLVEKVIAEVDEDQLARLHKLVDEMYAIGQAGGFPAVEDHEFHRILHEKAGNSIAARVIDVFWEAFYQVRIRAGIVDPFDSMDGYRRHKLIVDALEARDVERLKEAMREHTTGTVDRIQITRQQLQATKEKE